MLLSSRGLGASILLLPQQAQRPLRLIGRQSPAVSLVLGAPEADCAAGLSRTVHSWQGPYRIGAVRRSSTTQCLPMRV